MEKVCQADGRCGHKQLQQDVDALHSMRREVNPLDTIGDWNATEEHRHKIPRERFLHICHQTSSISRAKSQHLNVSLSCNCLCPNH